MQCKYCHRDIPDGSLYCMFCGKMHDKPKPKKRLNGEGTIHKEASGRYRATATRFEAGQRLTKSKRFDKLKEAHEWLSSITWAEVGAVGKPVSFSDLYAEWSALHYPTISKKKQSIYEGVYKRCGSLYSMRWSDIGLRHLQAVVNSQKDTYYPRRDCKILFNLMSKYAIDCGYSSVNYADKIKLPMRVKPHKEAFSDADIAKLWTGYNGGVEFAGVILIMIYTGMRYGEITTVMPGNVFLAKGYLLGGKKSEAGIEGEIILVPEIRPVVQKMLIDGGLKQMSDTAFRKHYNHTLAECGCAEHTIHECRHTTATVLAKAGVQPAIIKEVMRHSSYQMTMEYTHIDRDTKIEAVTSALHPNI